MSRASCPSQYAACCAAVRDAELYSKTLQIEHLKAQLAVLRRARFGRSSEKLDRKIEQLELLLGELEEGVAENNDRPELERGACGLQKAEGQTGHRQTRPALSKSCLYRNSDGFRGGVRRCRQSTCQQIDHPYPGGCGPTRAGNHQRTDIGCSEFEIFGPDAVFYRHFRSAGGTSRI
jgi:hypothetical protein